MGIPPSGITSQPIGAIRMEAWMRAPIPTPVAAAVRVSSIVGVAAAAVSLIGLLGGDSFRDGQLDKIGYEFDRETGLSRRKPEPNGGQRSISEPPPFTGGQSLGVIYNVTRKTLIRPAVAASPTYAQYPNYGDISGGGGVKGYHAPISYGYEVSGDRMTIRAYIDSGTGRDYIFNSTNGVSGQPISDDSFFKIISVVRQDGLPDTGGDVSTATRSAPSGYTESPPEQDRDKTPPPPIINPSQSPPSTTPDRKPEQDRRFAPPPVSIAPPPPSPSQSITNNSNSSSSSSSSTTTNNTFNTYNFAPPLTAPPPPLEKEKKELIPPPPKKEEDKKLIPPPPTPPPTPPPSLSGIMAQLASIGAISALINANTQPEALKNAAKTGSCESLQSPSCTEGIEDRIKNPLNAKLDAAQIARDSNAAAQSAGIAGIAANQVAQNTVLAAISAKATSIFDFLNRVWQNQAVDKAMMYITMITTIHNAAMLSRGLLETLGSALDSGLQVFGLQIKDKEGNQLGVTAAIGATFQNLVKGIIGADNYTALNNTWAQANRIYQSGINLLSNVQSILDSTTAVAELTSNRVGTLMNALRNSGVVRENAYGSQSQNVTKFNSYLEKMQNLEQGVSNLASITGNIVSVQQSVNELRTNKSEFDKALADKPAGGDPPTNTATEAVKMDKAIESKFTILDFSIVKAPETNP